MLGCIVVDYVKGNRDSNNGKAILLAVADVLLTKLIFEEWRTEEKSDELYVSRFEYFSKQFKNKSKKLNINAWFQLAMIPIGLSAQTLDEAQLEARRCLRVMNIKPSKKLEGEIIASLIFLGKEGLEKEVIPYFLEAEYQINLAHQKTAFSHAIKSLIQCDIFQNYVEEVCVYRRQNYRMMCGGMGQAYYNQLPSAWVNQTLDFLETDVKSMLLSFMRTFNCCPAY